VLDQYDMVTARVLFEVVKKRKAPKINGKAQLASILESVLCGRMPSRLLEETLADLLAKRPQTLEERAAIDAAIAAVVRGMQGSGGRSDTPPTTTAEAPTPQQVPPKALSESSPFYGLGLKEAAPKQISIAGKPQFAREIWAALKAEGYQTAHSDPVHAVNDALRRRAKTHGDVLLVGRGQWGRPEWYTEEQLEEIKKSIGGMGGRDRGSHIERTKTGMAVAMARGARVGAASKLSAEQWLEVEQMLSEGTSPAEVATKYGIHRQSIYMRYNRIAIRELRDAHRRKQAKEKDGAVETRH
jgi:transposase